MHSEVFVKEGNSLCSFPNPKLSTGSRKVVVQELWKQKLTCWPDHDATSVARWVSKGSNFSTAKSVQGCGVNKCGKAINKERCIHAPRSKWSTITGCDCDRATWHFCLVNAKKPRWLGHRLIMLISIYSVSCIPLLGQLQKKNKMNGSHKIVMAGIFMSCGSH